MLHQAQQVNGRNLVISVDIGIEQIDFHIHACQIFFKAESVLGIDFAIAVDITGQTGNNIHTTGGNSSGNSIFIGVDDVKSGKGNCRKAIRSALQNLELKDQNLPVSGVILDAGQYRTGILLCVDRPVQPLGPLITEQLQCGLVMVYLEINDRYARIFGKADGNQNLPVPWRGNGTNLQLKRTIGQTIATSGANAILHGMLFKSIQPAFGASGLVKLLVVGDTGKGVIMIFVTTNFTGVSVHFVALMDHQIANRTVPKMEGPAFHFVRFITGNLMLMLFKAANGAYTAFIIGMFFIYPRAAGFAGPGMVIAIHIIIRYEVHIMLVVYVTADGTGITFHHMVLRNIKPANRTDAVVSISKSLIVDNLMRMDLILAGRTGSTGHVMLSEHLHVAHLANTRMEIAIKICNRLPFFYHVLMFLVAAKGTYAILQGVILINLYSTVRADRLMMILILAGIGKGMFMFLVAAGSTGITIHHMLLRNVKSAN